MKVAIITDSHFGARNDSPVFARHFSRFYNEVFFPYLEEKNIKRVIHLGDLVDRRKCINYQTLDNLLTDFLSKLYSQKITLTAVVGNHDCYYKNTNKVNAWDMLAYSYSEIDYHVNSCGFLDLDGTQILLCPWITPENKEWVLEQINNSPAQVLMGHFEISGCEMQKGQLCDHGLSQDLFKKFDCVFSGHFHQKSSTGNITYLGAPYEMTWADAEQPRGFHVFDTKTRELEFIRNPNPIFHHIVYEDECATIHDVEEMEVDSLKDGFIKVHVKEKHDPELYDLFIDKLNKCGAAEVKIIENSLNLLLEEGEAVIDGEQDTPSIIRGYIQNIEANTDREKIEKLMLDLYGEATTL